MIKLYKFIIIFIIFFILSCQPEVITNETKPKIKEKEVIDSKVELLNKMPEWCKSPKITIIAIQVCGIAESSDIQTSRTRSALDGRKQLARRFNTEINQNLKESDKNITINTQSTTKFNVKRSTILKRKTVVINDKYATYTLIVYPL